MIGMKIIRFKDIEFSSCWNWK